MSGFPSIAPTSILIAGMGNVLAHDDGFGVIVVRRLMKRHRWPPSVQFLEVGIAGIVLVQELMVGYDALVLIDAIDRGGPPGRVYWLRPHLPKPTGFPAVDFRAETHHMEPGRVLWMARALGVLPPRVWLIGCQPQRTDLGGMSLSRPVARAVSIVTNRLAAFLRQWLRDPTAVPHAGTLLP